MQVTKKASEGSTVALKPRVPGVTVVPQKGLRPPKSFKNGSTIFFDQIHIKMPRTYRFQHKFLSKLFEKHYNLFIYFFLMYWPVIHVKLMKLDFLNKDKKFFYERQFSFCVPKHLRMRCMIPYCNCCIVWGTF